MKRGRWLGGKKRWGTIQCGGTFKFSILGLQISQDMKFRFHTNLWNLNLCALELWLSTTGTVQHSLLCALEFEILPLVSNKKIFSLKSSQMAVGNLLLRGASSTKTILHQVNRRMLDEKKLKNKIEEQNWKHSPPTVECWRTNSFPHFKNDQKIINSFPWYQTNRLLFQVSAKEIYRLR